MFVYKEIVDGGMMGFDHTVEDRTDNYSWKFIRGTNDGKEHGHECVNRHKKQESKGPQQFKCIEKISKKENPLEDFRDMTHSNPIKTTS